MFYVMGNSFNCQYDGILGHDFSKNKRATIKYCNRKITIGGLTMNFDYATITLVVKTHK